VLIGQRLIAGRTSRISRFAALATGLLLVGTAVSVPVTASAASSLATVTGTLVNSAGNPLTNVDVFISIGGSGGSMRKTNSAGTFTYTHSIHKAFAIWTARPGIGDANETITIRPVKGKTTALGVIPWVGGSVEGEILPGSTSSRPTSVSLINSSGKEVASTVVDFDTQRFRFSYAKTGSYAVRFEGDKQNWTYLGNTSNFTSATRLAVSPTVAYDRDITPVNKTGVITGKLSPKSSGYDSAAISIEKVDGSELDRVVKLYDSGTFSFTALPAGKYRLRVLNVDTYTYEYFRGSGKTATKLVSKAKTVQVGTGTKNVGKFTIKKKYYEDSWD
jgi:hypothetical protein